MADNKQSPAAPPTESPPGGPGSIAAAHRVPDPGQRGIASGGTGLGNDPAGSRLAGKASPAAPGGTTGQADAQMGAQANMQDNMQDGALGGSLTNDALPGGGATDDTASTPNKK